jgi:hypothetical protein
VPETKGATLEELDEVFAVPAGQHAAYGARQAKFALDRYAFRRDVRPEPLYSWHFADPAMGPAHGARDAEKGGREERREVA